MGSPLRPMGFHQTKLPSPAFKKQSQNQEIRFSASQPMRQASQLKTRVIQDPAATHNELFWTRFVLLDDLLEDVKNERIQDFKVVSGYSSPSEQPKEVRFNATLNQEPTAVQVQYREEGFRKATLTLKHPDTTTTIITVEETPPPQPYKEAWKRSIHGLFLRIMTRQGYERKPDIHISVEKQRPDSTVATRYTNDAFYTDGFKRKGQYDVTEPFTSHVKAILKLLDEKASSQAEPTLLHNQV